MGTLAGNYFTPTCLSSRMWFHLAGFVPISRHWGTSFPNSHITAQRGFSLFFQVSYLREILLQSLKLQPPSQSSQGVCLSEDPVYMSESHFSCSSDCRCHHTGTWGTHPKQAGLQKSACIEGPFATSQHVNRLDPTLSFQCRGALY